MWAGKASLILEAILSIRAVCGVCKEGLRMAVSDCCEEEKAGPMSRKEAVATDVG